jgi:hypothetical protein
MAQHAAPSFEFETSQEGAPPQATPVADAAAPLGGAALRMASARTGRAVALAGTGAVAMTADGAVLVDGADAPVGDSSAEAPAGSPGPHSTTTNNRTGGGMSLQDTIAQIASLERAIQDQTRLINDFLKSNRDTMQLVRTELKGSTKGYDQMMVNSLSQVESSLTSSLSSLRRASEALTRVRAI